MSKKNKAARAFFHQNPDATPKDSWDAAWANNQSTFHAKSMQEKDARIVELESQLAAERDHNGVLRELVADAMEIENEFESDWDKAARAALAS